jgi:putative endonuclease
MFFVYVLQNESGDSYTGQTSNLPTHLNKHNSNLSQSTKNRGPWVLIHHEIFATRGEALRRERELKTGKGRDELKRIQSFPIEE